MRGEHHAPPHNSLPLFGLRFGLRSEGTIQRKLLGAGTGAGDLEAAYLWGRRDVVRVADARVGVHRVIEAVVAHHVVSTGEVGRAHRVGGVEVPHRVLEQDTRGAATEEGMLISSGIMRPTPESRSWSPG
jgi:hypothetical protein